jgi:hypothetical protein
MLRIIIKENSGQMEAAERRRVDNARTAKEAADKEFPDEKWIAVEEGIYLSPRRAIGKGSNYPDELRDARILRDLGNTVYLAPEARRAPGKKYDALVNGEPVEFKNVGGNANTLITHFFKSRSQAPNVFINLETSALTRKEAVAALYGARNSKTHRDKHGSVLKGYNEYNAFQDGCIILKVANRDELICLDVDNLEMPE